MAKAKRSNPFRNPFYVLVVLVGVLFLLTVCAYAVLAFSELRGPSPRVAESALLMFLDQHGVKTMGVQLLILTLATLLAMTSDSWFHREETSDSTDPPAAQPTGEPNPPAPPNPGTREE